MLESKTPTGQAQLPCIKDALPRSMAHHPLGTLTGHPSLPSMATQPSGCCSAPSCSLTASWGRGAPSHSYHSTLGWSSSVLPVTHSGWRQTTALAFFCHKFPSSGPGLAPCATVIKLPCICWAMCQDQQQEHAGSHQVAWQQSKAAHVAVTELGTSSSQASQAPQCLCLQEKLLPLTPGNHSSEV